MGWEQAEPGILAVLPKVAAATDGLDRVLVGGTALALQLRHRASFDIDVQVLHDFDAEGLVGHLERIGVDVDVQHVSVNALRVVADGTKVEGRKSAMRQTPVGKGPVIEEMPVASLLDLFALKLRAVRNRAQLRDYVDIAALIDHGIGLMEGIRAYAARFHLFLIHEDLHDVFSVLTPPPDDLPMDVPLEEARGRTLESVHLAAQETIRMFTRHTGLDPTRGNSPEQPRLSQ